MYGEALNYFAMHELLCHDSKKNICRYGLVIGKQASSILVIGELALLAMGILDSNHRTKKLRRVTPAYSV